VTLTHLLPHLKAEPGIATVVRTLASGQRDITVADLPSAFRPALIAASIDDATRPVLVVTSRADRADTLCTAINEFLPPERQAMLWISPEALPYEQLPFDLAASADRVALLGALKSEGATPPIIVVAAHGLMHLVVPPDEFEKYTISVKTGAKLNIDTLLAFATKVGFQPVPLVQEAGQIARRGGIIDLWPAASEFPVRIDFFGDEVDSIRRFNSSSQRSDQRLTNATILPPTELPLWRLANAAAAVRELDTTSMREEVRDEWERMLTYMDAGITPASIDIFSPYLVTRPATLLDYLPADTLVIQDEPSSISLAIQNLERQADELKTGFETNGELPKGLRNPYAGWLAIDPMLHRGISMHLGIESATDGHTIISLTDVGEAPFFAGRMQRITDEIAERLAEGWRVVVSSEQVERLTEIFEDRSIFPRSVKRNEQEVPPPLLPGMLEIRPAAVDGGWTLTHDRTMLLTDLELFGFRKVARHQSTRSLTESVAFANSLTPGEFVVHIDHGIAKFTGLTRTETGGVEREYLLLEYAKGDKLYVPVDQSSRVTRYTGGGIDPQPTKLGSGEWVRVKQRVRKAVREMAFELVQLYAVRESGKGHAFPPDTTWDLELADSFAYTETVDQRRAIDDVKSDMESTRPMDRLICGDVGFGKTEVALRAAFKAVNGGMQVAVLVPTTVLALQHFETFSQRLAAYPIKVEMLSRLRTKAEQKVILEGLGAGTVDIVIGTHRLVQKDVRFKSLGLAIVDEEQRFGVRHKEFMKQMRTEIDVLTMSATPIPRTLHMSLAGIRDISVINTAPQARLPIRTFVTPTADQLLREVILREIDRGGQIYVVHNRVQSIDRVAGHLRHLIPEAQFGIGHGQMDEEVLEQVILSFVRKEYDVLVSTTIIESGIDIPNVNTIIIDNADTMGLTQLYQLRGRVGRGAKRAYAYLVYRQGKAISPEARERLEAIQEATELGAGLQVAMRDMEIRGAGNILGAEQSGHIAAIGYDLYIRLLAQAVEEIKQGRPFAEQQMITLDLPLTALIPADYIADTELRLATYRRVASVASMRELHAMREELVDRFGELPEEVERLFSLITLRLRCEQLHIESIVEREREIVLRPVNTKRLDARQFARNYGTAVRLTPNSVRIKLPELNRPWQVVLDSVLDAVERVVTEQLSPVGAAATAG
jgi:transcription-repair coupling factor (superfamily II helicase)